MYNSQEKGKQSKFGKLQNNQQYRERSKGRQVVIRKKAGQVRQDLHFKKLQYIIKELTFYPKDNVDYPRNNYIMAWKVILLEAKALGVMVENLGFGANQADTQIPVSKITKVQLCTSCYCED